MKKTIIVACLSLLLACNKGVWITQHVYRPKHPDFSILKKPFKANALVNNISLYVSTRRFINYDHNVVIGYVGFYSDGRMIIDNTWEKEMEETLKERGSFKTASSIGYYISEGNTIVMEFFVPGDGGHYLTRKGIVKKDTIIMIDMVQELFHKRYDYDTLVISGYSLQYN